MLSLSCARPTATIPTAPRTPTATLSSSTLVCFAHLSQCKAPPLARRAAHLSRWLPWLRRPRSPQKHRPRKPRRHLGHKLLCTHKQIHYVCTSHHHLHARLRLHPHFAQTTWPSPTPKLNSRVRTGTRFPIKPNPSFIRRLAAVDPLHRPSADEALRDPWLANTPSHVDLSPTLRQNRSLRTKWRSAVTRIKAANRFAAAESRSSAQSSGEWHEEQEEEELMPGAFEPVRRDLEKESGWCFSCKVIISHFENSRPKNKWRRAVLCFAHHYCPPTFPWLNSFDPMTYTWTDFSVTHNSISYIFWDITKAYHVERVKFLIREDDVLNRVGIQTSDLYAIVSSFFLR